MDLTRPSNDSWKSLRQLHHHELNSYHVGIILVGWNLQKNDLNIFLHLYLGLSSKLPRNSSIHIKTKSVLISYFRIIWIFSGPIVAVTPITIIWKSWFFRLQLTCAFEISRFCVMLFNTASTPTITLGFLFCFTKGAYKCRLAISLQKIMFSCQHSRNWFKYSCYWKFLM